MPRPNDHRTPEGKHHVIRPDLGRHETGLGHRSLIYPPTPNPGLEDASSMDPSDLAEAVRHEIASATNLAIKLSKSKRLPPADYAAFKKFHTAWNIYSGQHSGKWTKRDNLNLWNLRQINRQFNARFKVFDTVAKTPITKPGAPSPAVVGGPRPPQATRGRPPWDRAHHRCAGLAGWTKEMAPCVGRI